VGEVRNEGLYNELIRRKFTAVSCAGSLVHGSSGLTKINDPHQRFHILDRQTQNDLFYEAADEKVWYKTVTLTAREDCLCIAEVMRARYSGLI
jgi:hypothetical protein